MASGTTSAIQDNLLVVDVGSLHGHELEKQVSLILLPQIEFSDEIVSFFNDSKAFFLAPLQCFDETPNATQRSQLGKGSIQVRQDASSKLTGLAVNPTIQQHVSQMSDDLHLAEATCLKYWILASEPQNRYMVTQRNRLTKDLFHDDIPKAARQFVLLEVSAIISALLRLFRARLDTSLPSEKRDIIVSYTNELIRDDLFGKLLRLLTDVIPNLMKHPKIQKAASQWQKSLSEVLFSLVLSTHLVSSEVKLLATLGKSLASRLENVRSHVVNTLQSVMGLGSSMDNLPFDAQETASLLHTINYAQASFASALLQEVHRLDRNSGDQTPPSQLPSSTVQELNAIILNEKWITPSSKLSKIQSVFGFFYSTFLAKIQFNDPRVASFFTECVEGNCFSFMTNALLPFAPSSNDVLSRQYYHIYEQVFLDYSRHFFNSSLIPKAEATTPEPALSITTHGDTTEDILNWATLLCEHSPNLSTLCWSSPLMDTFVNKCSDMASQNERARIAYMHFLAVAGAGNPAAAYKHIKDSPPPITWKRFFSAIESYRRLLMPDVHHGSANQQPSKQIAHKFSSLEVDALDAMFHIFQTMVQDDTIVHYFLDWPDVNVLLLFLGFVRCPIPSLLKGAVMDTLASFVTSAPMGQLMWQHLESAQILLTAPSTTMQTPSLPNQGILYELEQIESMQRKYPATLGFLKLLGKVFKYEFPDDCGASYRIAGAQPYLDFVLHVFLRADSREYDVELEKWQILEQCLSIFCHIIEKYTIQSSDFKDEFVLLHPHLGYNKNDKYYTKPKSLGFILLSKLLTDSTLLRKLLQVLTTELSVGHLEETSEVSQVKYTTDLCLQLVQTVALNATPLVGIQEHCVELTLAMINKTFDLEASFVSAARASSLELVVEPLHRLLIRTPQHIVTFSRFIRYQSSTIPVLSAKFIRHLSAEVPPTQLVELFQDHRADQELRDGYASVIMDEENVAVKKAVLDLMVENIGKSVPNVATLLLIEPNSNNCLDALLLVLDNLNFVQTQPELAERAHHLLYKALSNPKLNLLEQLDGFFTRQIKTLPMLVTIQRHLTAHRDVLALVGIRRWLLHDLALYLFQSKKAQLFHGIVPTLISLLDATLFVHSPPAIPLDDAGMKLADQCTIEHEQRLFIDAAKFQSALQAEASSPLIQWALSWNRYSERISIESNALDAWTSLVQVLIIDQHIQVKELYQLWQALLLKAKTRNAIAYLVELLSKVTVALSFQCRALRVRRSSAMLSSYQRMELIQETVNVALLTDQTTGNPAAARRARSWLYTSFLHLVRYGHEESNNTTRERDTMIQLVFVAKEPSLLDQFVWNESFLLQVCKDASEGTEPLSMGLAMNVLTLILTSSASGRVLLHRLLQSILPHLCNVLFQFIQTNQDGLVDSIVSFFLQLAQTKEGALILMHGGVVRTLMQATTFPLQRPHFRNDMETWFGEEQVYYQKWLPILHLLVSITTSLPENTECIQSIVIFLHKHIKLVSGALNLEVHYPSLQRLTEMAYVAQLLRTASAHPKLFESLLGTTKVVKLTKKIVTIVSYYGHDLGSFTGWWNQIVPRTISEQECLDVSQTSCTLPAITNLFEQSKWDAIRLLLCQATAYCRIRMLSWNSPMKRKSEYVAIQILENDTESWLRCLRTWITMHENDIDKDTTLFLIENVFTVLAHHALDETHAIAAQTILSILGTSFENYALLHLLSRKLRDISPLTS